MKAKHIFYTALEQGVQLFCVKGKLGFKVEQGGSFSAELKTQVKEHKAAIIDFLEKYDSDGDENNEIPLRPSELKSSVELSLNQHRLWLIDQIQGGASEYNMPMAFEVTGHMCEKTLNKVLQEIINRHEVLRTRYSDTGEDALQHISDEANISLQIHDLSHLQGQEQEQSLMELMEKDIQTPFNLTQDLMIRVTKIHLCRDKSSLCSIIIFNMHHIASDGWSMDVLTREFFILYQAYSQGQPNPLAPLPIQYADYAYWQRNWLQGDIFEKQLSYWEKQLADAPQVHSLPLDFPRPDIKQHKGALVVGRLSKDTTKKLHSLAKQHQLTPFMLMHAALTLVLSRHSNSNDIVVATNIGNRTQPQLEQLIGFFVNTVVLRTDTSDTTANEFFKRVRQSHLEAQSNQHVSIEQLAERLQISRNSSYTPMFQIILNTTSGDKQQGETPVFNSDVEIKPISLSSESVKFDINLSIHIDSDHIEFKWLYDKSIFKQDNIARINLHLENTLEQFTTLQDSNTAKLSELSMLTKTEVHNQKTGLIGRQRKAKSAELLHQLIEEQALNLDDNVAIIDANHSGTYQQLNDQANQIANHITQLDITGPIAICCPRKCELLVAILGVMKSGHAYIPLDPKNTQSRNALISVDAGVSLILAHSEMLGELPIEDVNCILLDDAYGAPDWKQESIQHENAPRATANDVAYIIYTSGSTGTPKGVQVTHSNLLDYCNYGNCAYYQSHLKGSVVATSHGFDLCVPSLFLPLINGGTVDLSMGDNIIVDLVNALESANKSKENYLLRITPTHILGLLPLLNTHQYNNRHVFVIGGEALSTDLAKQLQSLFPNSQLYNHYGPTEATIGSTLYDITTNQNDLPKHLPIGKPMDNTQLLILGPDLQLLPQGSIGELYIGGDGVCKGYVNQPDLNESQFVINPYHDENVVGSCARLYRTADMVRQSADGNIEFISRRDSQTKIRGYLIEPGEIEQSIIQQDRVKGAKVIITDKDTEFPRILAFVQPQQLDDHNIELTEEKSADYLTSITKKLNEQLPSYLVPNEIFIVQHWPETTSGKVDIKTLLSGCKKQPAAVVEGPCTDTESELVKIWAELTQQDENCVSINTNLFEQGGHSLLLIRYLSKVKEQYDIALNMNDFFEKLTIKAIADFIEQVRWICEISEENAVANEEDFEEIQF